MRHGDVLCVTVLLFYFQAETSGTQQLNGVLGESITFKINESKWFRTISWSRLEKNKSSTVALVTIGKPCKLLVPLPAFKKRVSTSRNCRNLQFSFLRQEDGTRYAADIILTSARTITETFDLKVYKRLHSQDLMIQCMTDGAGQKTLRLNCSAGPWNDSLHLDWHLTAGMSGLRDGSSLVINYSNIRAFDVKVTCEAENPISKASKTKTLRGACPMQQRYSPSTGVVTGFIIGSVVMTAACTAGVVLWLAKSPPRFLSVPCSPSQSVAEGEPSSTRKRPPFPTATHPNERHQPEDLQGEGFQHE